MATDYEDNTKERKKALERLEKLKDMGHRKKRYTKRLKNGIIISSTSLERLNYLEQNLTKDL